MSAVFSHGRLRLYLLRLLADGPKHGYEIIRLLENRFHGLYAPSAGTIYPRLARLEADGLMTHTASGGRKVYQITAAGRAELAGRAAELTALEAEIRESVAGLAALAGESDEGGRRPARGLTHDLRQGRHPVRGADGGRRWPGRPDSASGGHDAESDGPGGEVIGKAADLAAEVRRLVGLGRASADDLRVASTVLDSVRDQLRHILRG